MTILGQGRTVYGTIVAVSVETWPLAGLRKVVMCQLHKEDLIQRLIIYTLKGS